MRAPLLLALLGAGCQCPGSTPFPQSVRHVVIVSMDTVRADHLGCYGHASARTPRLDALCAQSVVFERHTSAAPTTLASHTALMTGNYPNHHGVARNEFLVSDENRLLAEVLKDGGFATGAVIGAMPLLSNTGFLQGVDWINEDLMAGRGSGLGMVDQAQRRADAVTDRAIDFLGEHDPSKERLFLFAHYFDAHAPYDPPEPFRTDNLGDIELESLAPKVGKLQHIARTRAMVVSGRPGGKTSSEQLRRLYLGEIAYVDEHVGRLVDALAEKGILDETLLVITSDHGETQDTHWEPWNHGYSLYEEAIHTPLIVRLPGGVGARRVDRAASNVDVFPTLVEALGLDAGKVDGQSFLPLLRGEQMGPRGPVFSEATKPYLPEGDPWLNDLRWKSVRDGDQKLIFDPISGMKELYNLDEDPAELINRVGEDGVAPAPGPELEAALAGWRSAAAPLASQAIASRRTRSMLEALGYTEAAIADELSEDDREAAQQRSMDLELGRGAGAGSPATDKPQ